MITTYHNKGEWGGAEPHGQDHQNHRDHGGGVGDNHQHSIGTTRGASTEPQQPHKVHRVEGGHSIEGEGGQGGVSNLGSHIHWAPPPLSDSCSIMCNILYIALL